MSKLKWLWLECNDTVAKVTNAILGQTFDLETGRGFIKVSKSKESISGVFIERTISREHTVDPFGATSEMETVRYQSTQIKVYIGFEQSGFLLEVIDPPRSIKTLVTELANILNQLTVKELAFPILKIYERLKKKSPRARITRLIARGLAISQASEIKVEVHSSEDAFQDFNLKFPEAVERVEKIRIERAFSHGTGPLEISANGLCLFDESLEEEVRALILDMVGNNAVAIKI